MINLYRKCIILFSVVIVIMTVFTILLIGNGEQKLANDSAFIPVSVVGEISLDGKEFEPLDPERTFDLDSQHMYRIKGHFTKDIEKNQQIMLRISDLWVRIEVNGQEIFAFGNNKQHSSGNVWQSFTSPGITVQDEVEIELYNIYTGVHPLSINQFLNQMRFGSIDGLYKMAFSRNGFSMLIGFLIFVIGICEWIIALVMLLIRQEGVNRVFYSAGFAVFSGIWFCIQFNIISLLVPYPRAVATADVLSPYLMASFFALYITTYLTGKLRYCGWFNSMVALVYTGGCIFLILFMKIDAYHTISVGWTLSVLELITSLLYLGIEYNKKHDRAIRIFGLSLLPILVGMLLDAYGYWSGSANDTMWLRSCFLLFVLIQMIALLWQIRENTRKAERVEKELMQNRIITMLSQIQNSIYGDCTR